jgi:hypothetical protein
MNRKSSIKDHQSQIADDKITAILAIMAFPAIR